MYSLPINSIRCFNRHRIPFAPRTTKKRRPGARSRSADVEGRTEGRDGSNQCGRLSPGGSKREGGPPPSRSDWCPSMRWLTAAVWSLAAARRFHLAVASCCDSDGATRSLAPHNLRICTPTRRPPRRPKMFTG